MISILRLKLHQLQVVLDGLTYVATNVKWHSQCRSAKIPPGQITLVARFMGPTWGPPRSDKTQVGPMWATWTLLSGKPWINMNKINTTCCSSLFMYHTWWEYHSGTPLVWTIVITLTLSQWSSSGNPVAIQCAWNLDPSVHWNATGEMPVCFQWSSSGFPVVFQCVPIMQINTGSPLGHHWVLASASVVPVASQCNCGSSGLPVCSNYAN